MYEAQIIIVNLRQLLSSEILCFLFVNVLHQHTLVLKNITLHLKIQFVVPT